LYQSDESHPSLSGSYLTACVFYSSIFQKTTIGSNYTTGLPSADIFAMQTIGSNTVLDSISNWNLNSTSVLANFSYTNTAVNAYQFFNTSINATNYLWSFGSTQASPSFTFAGSGPYSIKLLANNGCKTDSTEIQVSSTTSVRNYNKIDLGVTLYPNPSENIVSVKSKYSIYSAKIINQMGDVVLFQNNIKKGNTIDLFLKDLSQGIYFMIIETSKGVSKQKVVKI
jgi:PKD repeat protein